MAISYTDGNVSRRKTRHSPNGRCFVFIGTEDREKNWQFYCNECHQQMCEQCRKKHQKNPDTKKKQKHEVVPYNQRKPQLSVKKCKLHPTRKIEINLKDSNLPLCLKCVVKKGHLVIHLRTLKIYMLTKLNVVRQKFRKSKKIGQPPTT